MNYVSTRGAGAGEHHSFSDILLGGLARDGGLYLPADYPTIGADELARWRGLSYADLAFEILSKFCDDVPAHDLRDLTRRTYTAATYCNVRHGENAAKITPLRSLGVENGAPLALLELSNGPTLAFKDMAMQLLGNLFEYALAKAGQQLNILGATSGDTGSAAEYAMRGKKGVRVFMLSPHRKMSPFQTAQMFSLQDPNIFNLAVEGVFDDCQDIVKAVSNDHAFKAQHKIGTVNSINWARVVAQVVYYFAGYFAATKSNDERVSFTVPSGNFGNVCAGHIARMMGLPIEKLVVATNENDVLDEFFRTGIYRVRGSAETWHTSSPSMDISKASNFERFVYDLLGRDPARVRQLFADVEQKGGFDLAASGDFARVAQFGFVSGRSSHADRIATIRDVFSRYDTMIDTHTADGVKVAREHLQPGVPMVVLETAQPVKFGETIREALQREPERPAAFAGLEALPQRFEVVAADAQRVKDYVAAHTEG
ncbi:threonine synthase [Paraburkholderia caballeronis]|uniref:Threonine synthase n=1 Tax=Paraburkholderia caballeronis TaxID=416943 RepID=A0A1H7JP89_9BURK|nr:threonine synthase [Paraburkholderia caballeronis]PXW27332.1 L-threonine synthase [Paraburkholderia caballeronis]PXX02806.1 L-threonine synthase [Paraburkholderia caballeronis]RAK03531.1 L-threonine synthase [Paraburkholderia caballeronis]SEC35358.1 L-threonine synthase [Paraburkholderia caballeronis]SEK76382.1 L-threonine synthase [Paraburkholderia caballeronis]